jgi:hypothetical protein
VSESSRGAGGAVGSRLLHHDNGVEATSGALRALGHPRYEQPVTSEERGLRGPENALKFGCVLGDNDALSTE